jgi:GNAT superfamily N-acetyltransferase
MDSTLLPFTQDHLEPALDLFLENYSREKEHNPLLPSRVVDEPAWLLEKLQACSTNPGVAIVHQNQLLAYMLTGFQFPFKGQNAVLVPEYGHGTIMKDKAQLYQRMYLHLAQEWVNNQRHVHNIGYFAHDSILQETLYQLGFGAILAERIRDLSPLHDVRTGNIVEERNMEKLLPLDLEHNGYYEASPIFILKSTDTEEARSDLEKQRGQGDVFFVYYENDVPCAYMVVGESTIDGEGLLLQDTNTAQIKGAYAQTHVRGKGIGKALLHHAITWSQQHGYDRIFVEHETANFTGGHFWQMHFSPYVHFSMRYIDNRISRHVAQRC